MGDKKSYNLSPMYGFPTGHKNIRLLYVLCRDCKKEFFDPKCSFCEGQNHSMDDAVLFYISSHDKAYREGEKKILSIKNPNFNPS